MKSYWLTFVACFVFSSAYAETVWTPPAPTVTGNVSTVFPQIVCNGAQFAAGGAGGHPLIQNEIINIPTGRWFETQRDAGAYKLKVAYGGFTNNSLTVTLIDPSGASSSTEFDDYQTMHDMVTQQLRMNKPDGSGVGVACTLKLSKDSALPGWVD